MQEYPAQSLVDLKRATTTHEFFAEVDRAQEIITSIEVSGVLREAGSAGGRIAIVEAVSPKMPTNALFSTMVDLVRAKKERIRPDSKNTSFLNAYFIFSLLHCRYLNFSTA
jgi:hypothetical protein